MSTPLADLVQQVQQHFPNIRLSALEPAVNQPAIAFVNASHRQGRGHVYQIQIQPDALPFTNQEVFDFAQWVTQLPSRPKHPIDEKPWPAVLTLPEILLRADQTTRLIFQTALAGALPDVTPKKLLIAHYANLLLEHQAAMNELIRFRLLGAALALDRCIAEILYRALWATRCASEEDAQKVLDDRFDFPKKR